MNKYTYTIPESLDKHRVDKALAILCSDFSRSQVQKAIKTGQMTVNGVIIDSLSVKVKTDDHLEISLTEKAQETVAPKNLPLDIRYEDEYLMVINKAHGMSSHPGAGDYENTLVNALLYYTNNLSDLGGEIRPGIVHRLDKDTSGLMVVAKNNAVHEILAQQIQNRTLERRYLALIWGIIKPLEGSIDIAITRSTADRTKMTTVRSGGKVAVTHYVTKEVFVSGALSLVECRLETGRTHQIRVHFSHSRHSILGDQLYGDNQRKVNSCPDSLKQILAPMKRQALHSCYIKFIHPVTSQEIELTADLPQDYRYIIENLRSLSDSMNAKKL